MTDLKSVSPAAILKDVNDNFGFIAPLDGHVGSGFLKCIRAEFDTAGHDADGVDNTTVAAHKLVGGSLPAHALVLGGFVDVNTAFTSENANNATIALHVEGANDIISAAAVSGAPYSTIGRKAIVPKFNTPESTSVKTTVARYVTATVATSTLTAGKLTAYLFYVEGIASA